jgi:sugar/nucleoside kinase (ribokinase family)
MLHRHGRKYEAVCAGHISLDITPQFSAAGYQGMKIQDVLFPGKLINMNGVTVATGGSVANTGLSMNLLGVKTPLMGKIGADFFGETIARILMEHNGNCEWLSVSEQGSTSYSVIIAMSGYDRIILHDASVNDTFGIDDIGFDTVSESALFHFGYPQLMRKMYLDNGAELIRIFRDVKSRKVTTSLDVAYADPSTEAGAQDWKRFLKEILPFTDIFAPSIEEMLLMLRRDSYERIKAESNDLPGSFDLGLLPGLGRELIDMGAAIALIKCGSRGMYLKTASAERLSAMGAAAASLAAGWHDRELFSGVFEIEAVKSATGAGDVSIAGFLASLLRGKPAGDALSIASAAGALSASAFGAVEGLCPLEDIAARIAEGWRRRPVSGNDGRLEYDRDTDLYNIRG